MNILNTILTYLAAQLLISIVWFAVVGSPVGYWNFWASLALAPMLWAIVYCVNKAREA